MALEQADTTVSEAEHKLHSATERLAHAAHRAIDTLSQYGGRAEERLRDSGERSREMVDRMKHYVEDHPLAAIGIAAAVGFAVGMMLRPAPPAGQRKREAA